MTTLSDPTKAFLDAASHPLFVGEQYSPGMRIRGGSEATLQVGPFVHDIALRITRMP